MIKTDSIHKTRIFALAKIGVILCVLILFSSCFSIKPGSTTAGSKLYETFFVGEDGTQYFIKPLKFNTGHKEYLEMDITFRYKTELKDSATVNISFLSNELFKSMDSLKIYNVENSSLAKELNLLFTERNKDMYKNRFSTKINLADFKKLFANSDWGLKAYRNGDSTLYTPHKSTKKKVDRINYEIFELL